MITKLTNSRYMQYLSAITATFAVVTVGMSLSWSSPSLPKLQSEKDSPVGRKLSDEECSWVVSIFLLTSAPVPFIGGWGVDKFGRKKMLLFTAFLGVVQWLMVIFGDSLAVLLISRGIGGAAMAISIMTSAIYTGEIAEEDIRGKLSTFLILLKILGSLAVLAIGPYVSYVTLAIICSIVPVLFFCSFYFMPESPYYLVKAGKFECAKKNVITLCSNGADDKFVDDRLNLIQKTVDEDMKNKGSYREFFTKKQYRRALVIMFGVKTLQQFSGNTALEAYIQTIIEMSDSGLSPEVSSVIIGCIQLPAVLLSGLLVDKLGRRPLLITSALGCGLACFGEGIYFFFHDYLEKDTSSISWLPTTGLALFWIMNSIGCMTLPYVLLGELFPTNIKAIAVATASAYGGITAFVVSKFFKPLSNAIGMYTVFFIFTGICVGGAVFVYFLLPETKGKTFYEIQEILTGRKRDERDEDEVKK